MAERAHAVMLQAAEDRYPGVDPVHTLRRAAVRVLLAQGDFRSGIPSLLLSKMGFHLLQADRQAFEQLTPIAEKAGKARATFICEDPPVLKIAEVASQEGRVTKVVHLDIPSLLKGSPAASPSSASLSTSSTAGGGRGGAAAAAAAAGPSAAAAAAGPSAAHNKPQPPPMPSQLSLLQKPDLKGPGEGFSGQTRQQTQNLAQMMALTAYRFMPSFGPRLQQLGAMEAGAQAPASMHLQHLRAAAACLLARRNAPGPAGPHSMGAAELSAALQHAAPVAWGLLGSRELATGRHAPGPRRAYMKAPMKPTGPPSPQAAIRAIADGGALQMLIVVGAPGSKAGTQEVVLRLDLPQLEAAAHKAMESFTSALEPPAELSAEAIPTQSSEQAASATAAAFAAATAAAKAAAATATSGRAVASSGRGVAPGPLAEPTGPAPLQQQQLSLGATPLKIREWTVEVYGELARSGDSTALLKLSLANHLASVREGPLGPHSSTAAEVGAHLQPAYPKAWAQLAMPKIRALLDGDACWSVVQVLGNVQVRLEVGQLQAAAGGADSSAVAPASTGAEGSAAAAAVPAAATGPSAVNNSRAASPDAWSNSQLQAAAATVYAGSSGTAQIKRAAATALAAAASHSMLSLHMGKVLSKQVPDAWYAVSGSRFKSVFLPSDGILNLVPLKQHVLLKLDAAALRARAGMGSGGAGAEGGGPSHAARSQADVSNSRGGLSKDALSAACAACLSVCPDMFQLSAALALLLQLKRSLATSSDGLPCGQLDFVVKFASTVSQRLESSRWRDYGGKVVCGLGVEAAREELLKSPFFVLTGEGSIGMRLQAMCAAVLEAAGTCTVTAAAGEGRLGGEGRQQHVYTMPTGLLQGQLVRWPPVVPSVQLPVSSLPAKQHIFEVITKLSGPKPAAAEAALLSDLQALAQSLPLTTTAAAGHASGTAKGEAGPAASAPAASAAVPDAGAAESAQDGDRHREGMGPAEGSREETGASCSMQITAEEEEAAPAVWPPPEQKPEGLVQAGGEEEGGEELLGLLLGG